jgi:hypothetical protein
MHLAGRDYHHIALARETLCSTAPERTRTTDNQSERVGVVAMTRKGLRLVSRAQHVHRLAES